MKTGEQRRVPLHPELIRLVSLDFVATRGADPLFLNLLTRKAVQPLRGLVQDLGEWTQTTDITLSEKSTARTRATLSTTWFMTALRRYEVLPYVIKAIVGPAGSLTEVYGDTPLRTMAEAVCQAPIVALLKGPQC